MHPPCLSLAISGRSWIWWTCCGERLPSLKLRSRRDAAPPATTWQATRSLPPAHLEAYTMPRPRLNPEAPLAGADKARRWRASKARETGARLLRVGLDADDAARLAALELRAARPPPPSSAV